METNHILYDTFVIQAGGGERTFWILRIIIGGWVGFVTTLWEEEGARGTCNG